MLDKSVEYKNVIMRIKADKLNTVISPDLPDGLSFQRFNSISDMKDWCKIETAVLEFDSEFEAENYFFKAYATYIDKLKDRGLFVVN